MKIKAFFKNVSDGIKGGFREMGRAVSGVWSRLWQKKPMMKVKAGLSYIPNLITERVSYRKRQALWGIVFVIPLLIGFVYFFLLPFVVTLVYCFSRVYNAGLKSSTGEHIGIVTEWVGLDNFKYIFREHATFSDTLSDSTFSTLISFMLILIFSLIIAVLLNSKFRGRAFIRAIFFMPVIFNSQAVDVAMTTGANLATAMDASVQTIFTQMFNFNDFLINANLPSGFVTILSTAANQIYDIISYSGIQILIFLAGIQSIPKHLYEAAKIEGASQYDIFWKITFPMVSPLILTAGVYTVVDSFLRSDLLATINRYKLAGTVSYGRRLGELSYYGVHASMSLMFAFATIIVIGFVLFLLSKLVFYHDE